MGKPVAGARSRRLLAGLCFGLLLSAPWQVRAEEDDSVIVRCSDVLGCRQAVDLKGFADSIDSKAAAIRRAAAAWLNSHPSSATSTEALRQLPLDERKAKARACIDSNANLAEVCESFYLTEAEMDVLHPRPERVEISPDIAKQELQRKDGVLRERLSFTCGAPAGRRGDCRGVIDQLNTLADEWSRLAAKPAFQARYPRGVTFESARLADSLGIPKTNGKWDPNFGDFPAATAAAASAPPGASTPANAAVAFDMAELSALCRPDVESAIPLDADARIAEFNEKIAGFPVAQASVAQLEQWISDPDNVAEHPELRTYYRYERCIYRKRIEQLRLASNDTGVLRRRAPASTAALQAGFEQAGQWEDGAAAREAAAMAEKARQEQRDREYAERERKRDEKRARQASGSGDGWATLISVLGAAADVAQQVQTQRTASAAPTDNSGESDCIASSDEARRNCACMRQGLMWSKVQGKCI